MKKIMSATRAPYLLEEVRLKKRPALLRCHLLIKQNRTNRTIE